MTPEERASRATSEYRTDGIGVSRAHLMRCVATEIREAIAEERAANAETAWTMQMRDLGGGTSVGNTIAEGKRLTREETLEEKVWKAFNDPTDTNLHTALKRVTNAVLDHAKKQKE